MGNGLRSHGRFADKEHDMHSITKRHAFWEFAGKACVPCWIEEYDMQKLELEHKVKSLENAALIMNSQIRNAESRWLEISKANRELNNKVVELLGNIRVLCRVRPFSKQEIQSPRHTEYANIIEFPNNEEGSIIINPSETMRKKQKFVFDRVFEPDVKQEDVFEEIEPLIQSCLNGYSVCIFAYGQTGSGKTYTMEGGHSSAAEQGLNYRALEMLFRLRDDRLEMGLSFDFYVTMIEIYNEVIRDLLGSGDDSKESQKKFEIRKTFKGSSILGLQEIKVANPDEVEQLLALGNSNRSVGSHTMNHESSRSHSIFCIRIEGKSADGVGIYAKLHLVDLAGSERVAKTDAKGDRLLEAQHINKSLSALGDVISALNMKKDKDKHIPFRNSKLTYLLQECLGGDSKVMMIVTISPAVYNITETVSSLNFAKRCHSVELGQAKKQIESQESVKLKRLIIKQTETQQLFAAETLKASQLQERLDSLEQGFIQKTEAYSKLQSESKSERNQYRDELTALRAENARQKMEILRLTQKYDDSVASDSRNSNDDKSDISDVSDRAAQSKVSAPGLKTKAQGTGTQKTREKSIDKYVTLDSYRSSSKRTVSNSATPKPRQTMKSTARISTNKSLPPRNKMEKDPSQGWDSSSKSLRSWN